MTLLSAAAEPIRHDLHQTGVFRDALEFVVLGINAITALVVVWGILYGTARFIRAEAIKLSGRSCDKERADLRKQVGFYLLFALELLIAADVLQTMISPTLEHLAILAGVSFIRIVIGYALGKELSHIHPETDERPANS